MYAQDQVIIVISPSYPLLAECSLASNRKVSEYCTHRQAGTHTVKGNPLHWDTLVFGEASLVLLLVKTPPLLIRGVRFIFFPAVQVRFTFSWSSSIVRE
jgi:hypothetical protein